MRSTVKQYLDCLRSLDGKRDQVRKVEPLLYADPFNSFMRMWAVLPSIPIKEFKEMTYELWSLSGGDLRLKFLRRQKTMLVINSVPNRNKRVGQTWVLTIRLVDDPNISYPLHAQLHQPSDTEIDNLLREHKLVVQLTKHERLER